MKLIIIAILISQCNFSMIGCKDKSIDVKTPSVKDNQGINLNENYGVIYEYTKDINYKIYSSQFIDTYIIATALYNDFKCNNIMPNLGQHQIYIKAKEYFSPFKDHEFIKKLGKYTWNDDINCDIALMLNDYLNSTKSKPKEELKTVYAKGVFNSESELNEFLTLFKNFYTDTKADKFFNENSSIYSEMNAYVKNNIEKSNVINIIKETEKYVGNKDKYYNKNKIEYETVLTIYRPFMAMFNNIQSDNVTRIISFQSPNDFSRNPKTFDINQMISSTIHEFLHGFINIAVESNNNFINELAVGKDKKSFASPMYQNMPWNRIVDENFVRAIQGQIYKNIFNEERANNEILDKEIKFGGFTKLKGVYDKLNYYDKNREEYIMIDDFMPELIKELFSI